MSDFSKEARASAWWSGDTRKAVNGKANEAVLIKLGLLEPEDLSQVERVQMGHVMEPVIGRLAQDRLGIGLTKIEHGLAHPKHEWFRSHFDFVGEKDGKQILVEAKNYSAAVRQKFDPESAIVPAADLAQCIHEAAVFGVETVYLGVLFGGQEFTLTKLEISEQQKDELIKEMAPFWAAVQTRTPLPAETPAQARVLYPEHTQAVAQTTRVVEEACKRLKLIKANLSTLEDEKEKMEAIIQSHMQSCDVLTDFSGDVLATWRNAKPSMKFDAKAFEQAMPDIYKQFIREFPGSRRFLLK